MLEELKVAVLVKFLAEKARDKAIADVIKTKIGMTNRLLSKC